jgi:hypothetical protein
VGIKKLKVLFFLGFPNPFPGARWARIGFFAEDWFNEGNAIEVLGAFSYTLKKGFIPNSQSCCPEAKLLKSKMYGTIDSLIVIACV